ncbi:MAG: zinc-ribbon domain-containing protein [Acidobacteria bacterium]|nr:zinc-ribbon domain-containing protein [Acidobacteriota bacterium]
MVITCQQCSARLQLDDTKVPSRPFTVRCPKCQHIIKAQPQAPATAQGGALAVGETPAAHASRFARPMPAPAFRLEGAEDAGDAPQTEAIRTDRDEIAQLLSSLLSRAMTSAATAASQGVMRRAWDHRRALICASNEHRFAVARVLVESGYEVFVAEDTTQAIERMREDKMDIVVLDPSFDAVEQGAAFIRREISALRPAARRRFFFVVMSPEMRSGDAHLAFVNHANLALNPADVEELPALLDRAVRDFNELYRDLNKVLQVADF